MKPLDPEVKIARKIERLSKENTDLRAANRRLAANGAGYEDVLDELKAIIADSDPLVVYKAQQAKLPKQVSLPISKGHSEIAALVFSDWHISETVRPQDVNSLGSYNSMIAANRVNEVVRSAKNIVKLHQSLYKIDKLWIPMIGDFISGSIHQELSDSNDLSDPAATVLAAHLMYMAVMELKELGIPIQIDCAVGNHPRMTPTMPTKRQTETNLDWLAYEMLAGMLGNDKQVTVNIHTGQITMVKHYDWNYVIEHGYGIKHGQEEAAEDRIRAMFDTPSYRAAHPEFKSGLDMLVIGDQHRPKHLAHTIVNGALVGWSELATAWRLRPAAACQQLFGISKSHVRTWAYPLEVGHVVSDSASNPFSQYTQLFLNKHKR